MLADSLRKSILQAAIQGRLTQREVNDGDARDLLKEIQAERSKLISDGKIRRANSLPPISDDEIPFDIPDNWCWVRLGEIGKYIQRGKSPQYIERSSFPVISQKCVRWSGLDISSIKFISESSVKSYTYERFLLPNDILLNSTGTGTVGRLSLLREEDFANYKKMVADSHVTVIRLVGYVVEKYLLFYLSSPIIQDNMDTLTTGTTKQKELVLATVENIFVSLPPLAEQRRIVARLDELLPLVDALANDERELKAIEREFPDAIRKSLLQAAIQGRLTQREVNDGDVRDLLKEIQAERSKLISEGKVRRANPLPPINNDEIPFDIPDNWCWVRLGEIALLAMGKTPSRSDVSFWDGNIPWVAISDMRQGETITKTKERITSWALTNIFKDKIVKAGTLLMSFKLTIGRCCILGVDAVHNEAIVSIYPFVSPQIFNNYLMQSLPLLTGFGDVKGAMKGSTLNSSSLNNLLLPLPPLAEQRRIVARLDELLPLIEDLK